MSLFDLTMNILCYVITKLVTISVIPHGTANTTLKIMKVSDCTTTNLRSVADNLLVRCGAAMTSKISMCSFNPISLF